MDELFKIKFTNTWDHTTYIDESVVEIWKSFFGSLSGKKEISLAISNILTNSEKINADIRTSSSAIELEKIASETRFDTILRNLKERTTLNDYKATINKFRPPKEIESKDQHSFVQTVLKTISNLQKFVSNPIYNKALLITGGFGSGKTTLINHFISTSQTIPIVLSDENDRDTTEQIKEILGIENAHDSCDIFDEIEYLFNLKADVYDEKVVIIIDDMEKILKNQNLLKSFIILLEASIDYENIIWLITVDEQSLYNVFRPINFKKFGYSNNYLMRRDQDTFNELFISGWLNLELFNQQNNIGHHILSCYLNKSFLSIKETLIHLKSSQVDILNHPLFSALIGNYCKKNSDHIPIDLNYTELPKYLITYIAQNFNLDFDLIPSLEDFSHEIGKSIICDKIDTINRPSIFKTQAKINSDISASLDFIRIYCASKLLKKTKLNTYELTTYFYWGYILCIYIYSKDKDYFRILKNLNSYAYGFLPQELIDSVAQYAILDFFDEKKPLGKLTKTMINDVYIVLKNNKYQLFKAGLKLTLEIQKEIIYKAEGDPSIQDILSIFFLLKLIYECKDKSISTSKRIDILLSKIETISKTGLEEYLFHILASFVTKERDVDLLLKYAIKLAFINSEKISEQLSFVFINRIIHLSGTDNTIILHNLRLVPREYSQQLRAINDVRVDDRWKRSYFLEFLTNKILHKLLMMNLENTILVLTKSGLYNKTHHNPYGRVVEREMNIILGAIYRTSQDTEEEDNQVLDFVDKLISSGSPKSLQNAFFIIKHMFPSHEYSTAKYDKNIINRIKIISKKSPEIVKNFQSFFRRHLPSKNNRWQKISNLKNSKSNS